MKHRKLPNLEELRERLTYDERTGKLFWKASRSNRVKVGDEAGSMNQNYVNVVFNNTMYRAHRIIYYMYHGVDPDQLEVDHIDMDASNNRIENLRLATRAQNMSNKKIAHNSTTGLKNISKIHISRVCPRKGKKYNYTAYKVTVSHNHKKIQKEFNCSDPNALDKAIAYRDSLLSNTHGDFARYE